MAKITPKIMGDGGRQTMTVKTKDSPARRADRGYKWWLAPTKNQLCEEILCTALFLRQQQQYEVRQASLFARLYGNMPLVNFAGANNSKMNPGTNLPLDRPTMPVITSCTDTLISRLTQSKPRPVFLTDNSDYKERNLAKQLNQFILGEFYQTQMYQTSEFILRDATVLGTGCLKVFEQDRRVAVERVLKTEILVDPNDAFYGKPRQLFQMKLVDRSVLEDDFPTHRARINDAERAYPDNSADSSKTISDQVMIIEAWRLPSSKDAKDGRHAIVCSTGDLFDETFIKPRFPFGWLHYSPRLVGMWGQGLPEQLMGTQIEINKLLMTISDAINLVGVPRVFIEKGSKIVKAHINNMIGALVEYSGTKPIYEVAPCVPQELYAQLERLVRYAYEQSGISALAAAAQKPAGLNSGEAIRNYDELQSDRFSALSKRYDNFHVDCAYLITDTAKDIAIRDGKYQTIYTNNKGTREVDLPKASLLEDPFVIQCYDTSSLPRDPSGRLEKVTEMIQSGMISMQEGRRLIDFPDLEQEERLANAGEERILQILDEIIEEGKYTPPDPFMDILLAEQKVIQYYNLYSAKKLEEKKCDLLRQFFKQIQMLKMAATPPAPQAPQAVLSPTSPANPPLANPEALPTSPLVPNGPGTGM